MPDFRCPVCGETLIKGEGAFICGKGHAFDIAKQGYVNLLRYSASGKRHGDDKLMIQARRDFLDKGYYDRLSELLSDTVCGFAGERISIVDVGCGECKYISDVTEKLKRAGKKYEASGIDISKHAIIYGSKRTADISLAVAGAFSLPFQDKCADLIMSVFAPICAEEFCRVLRPEGKLIRAVPLERHLWELKELIYDEPYENKVGEGALSGFDIIDRKTLRYKIHLTTNEDIQNLFKMTPYYYKTGAEDQKKVLAMKELDTQIRFRVLVYKRA